MITVYLKGGRRKTRSESTEIYSQGPFSIKCAKTCTETQIIMYLLRLNFHSRKRVHGNDPYHLFKSEFSAGKNVRFYASMETGSINPSLSAFLCTNGKLARTYTALFRSRCG